MNIAQMEPLSEIFPISTRQEMVDIARTLNENLSLKLQAQPDKQILVRINGFTDSGKSLFWDEALAYFLPEPNERETVQEKTNNTVLSRRFETWEGHSPILGRDVRLFFCNIAALHDGVDIYSLLTPDFDLDNAGNIVMLTNTEYFSGNFSIHFDHTIEIYRNIEVDRQWHQTVKLEPA